MGIGVIGCGYWGKNLVRNFRELGALDLVCDTTVSGRVQASILAPEATIVDDVDELLRSNITAVAIATPAETHSDLAMRSLRAGKDVFVEKPLALNYHDGQEIVKAAAQSNKILMVGHVLEYHPAVVKLTELIATGTLGKIQYIYSNRLSLGKVRREENILWSFAPHDIAVILRIIDGMPFQVSASGGSYLQPNIADCTVTNLLFDNGIRAHIYVSWLHPFKEQRLVVIGSRQMATFDDVSKKLVLFDQRVEWKEGEPVPVRNEGQEIDFPRGEPLKIECQAFLEAIKSRKAPLTDGDSGLRVLRVLQAAQRSLVMNGEPVRLPLE